MKNILSRTPLCKTSHKDQHEGPPEARLAPQPLSSAPTYNQSIDFSYLAGLDFFTTLPLESLLSLSGTSRALRKLVLQPTVVAPALGRPCRAMPTEPAAWSKLLVTWANCNAGTITEACTVQHTFQTLNVAWSPNGRLLATQKSDGWRIFDAVTKVCLLHCKHSCFAACPLSHPFSYSTPKVSASSV